MINIIIIFQFLLITNTLHQLNSFHLSKFSNCNNLNRLLQYYKVHLSNSNHNVEVETFQNLGNIPQWLLNNCEKLGYTRPTPVQIEALPIVFQGKDVILQAQTGSGKTVSYCLPLLSKLDPTRAAIQAVVVVPSRELGLQVAGVLKQLSSGSPDKIMVMSLMEGSTNKRQQIWVG